MTGRIGADTSLLIDFFKGEEHAVNFIRAHAGELVVSELVIYEFLCGNITEKEQHIFLGAIQSFPTSQVNRSVALIASQLFRTGKKSGITVGHQDTLIAATYLAVGIKHIATRNAKHFTSLKDITVLEYTKK